MVRLERCVSRAGVPASGAGPAFPLTLLPGVPCPCPSVFWRDRAGIFFPAQAELWGDLDAGSSRPLAKNARRTGHPYGWWCQRKAGQPPPSFCVLCETDAARFPIWNQASQVPQVRAGFTKERVRQVLAKAFCQSGRGMGKGFCRCGHLGALAHVSKSARRGAPGFHFGCFIFLFWFLRLSSRLTFRFGRGCSSQTEQVPGLAVFLEEGAVVSFCALGIEADVGTAYDLEDWDDVPDVVRDDVSGDEIDLFWGILDHGPAVGFTVAVYGDAVSPVGGGENRFHLDAKQAAVLLDDQVVGFGVAVRLAYDESHAGGFDDEDQFPHHAFAFGIA